MVHKGPTASDSLSRLGGSHNRSPLPAGAICWFVRSGHSNRKVSGYGRYLIFRGGKITTQVIAQALGLPYSNSQFSTSLDYLGGPARFSLMLSTWWHSSAPVYINSNLKPNIKLYICF